MSSIVQINFPYTESGAEIENHSEEAAGRFTGVDGFQRLLRPAPW